VIEVLLCADPGDGNDRLEASTNLAIVPRIGDTISVWVSSKGEPQPPWIIRDTEAWLEVHSVILCSYAPEAIEVFVTMDTYDLDVLKRVFKAIDNNEQP